MKNIFVKQENTGELAEPSLKYKESFLEAKKEFQTEGENIYMHLRIDVSDLENNFEKFIKNIKDKEEKQRFLDIARERAKLADLKL